MECLKLVQPVLLKIWEHTYVYFFTLSLVPLCKSVECTSPVKPVLFVPLERQQPFTIRFLATNLC